MVLGSGRPLTKTPPSWFTSPHESWTFEFFEKLSLLVLPVCELIDESKSYMDISPGLLGSLDESDEAGDTDDDCMIISFFCVSIEMTLVSKISLMVV